MTPRSFIRAATVASLLLAGSARAAELIVPDQYATIQEAVAAAIDGDTVLVRPGTYYEAVTIASKTITLESTDGAAATIIDGGGTVRPLTIYGPEYRPTVRGFTFQNGWGSGGGGVLVTSQADPTFERIVVRNNRAYYGGGMYLGYGVCFVTISDSEIVDNVADYVGGGTYSNVSCTSLVRTRLARNVAGLQGGGAASIGFCTGVGVQNGFVTDNVSRGEGGAFFVSGSSRCGASIGGSNTVVARNAATVAGGGFATRTYGYAFATNMTVADNQGGGFWAEPGTAHNLVNTIFWNNGAAPVFSAASSWGQNTVTGVDMEGGVQTGFAGDGTNLSADPLFVDAAAGDYRLSPGSPCIDAGVAGGTAEDILGTPRPAGLGVDIGAYEYDLPNIAAAVVIDPGTLTRCAPNGVLTVYVTLPAGYDPTRVLLPSVFVDDAFAAERGVVENGVLVLKYPREAFQRYLEKQPDGRVTLTVTGELPGLARFSGTASIRLLTIPCK